jgi:hypothetical protein
MLVRALKVLNYFVSETIGTGIDTAALDQPGDEVGLMAEPVAISNDEPLNVPSDRLPDASRGAVKQGREK